MIAFHKMHGLGNDFVVVDTRGGTLWLPTPAEAAHICHRQHGVGCDQLIVLADHPAASAEMLIFNPDGSRAGMCGNAARCVAWLLADGKIGEAVTLHVGNRAVEARVTDEMRVAVTLGQPSVNKDKLPDFGHGLPKGVTVDVGNPHLVFFVPDVTAVDLAAIGPVLERHPFFPDRTNVEVAQQLSGNHFAMRVWERGAGLTQACGSGACAVAVAALAQGVSKGPRVRVDMPGGTLHIRWQAGTPVVMEGPVAYVFTGNLTATALQQVNG
jgi:diaminopimelate epimerase